MKHFISIITKWEYTWFAWLVNIFYLLIWSGALTSIPFGVIATMVCFTLSALIMASGRWWGCVIGVIFDLYLCSKYIYTVYLYYGKLLISELWLSLLIMVAVVVIHIIMGRMCYTENKKQG